PAALKQKIVTGAYSGWKISWLNVDYSLSQTYPAVVAVPVQTTDSIVKSSAKFRSTNRFPTLCWRSPYTGVSLSRCAQPCAGILGKSEGDEFYVNAMTDCCPARSVLYIFDARPRKNTVANTLIGKGIERAKSYKRARVFYLNIQNIHAVRNSYRSMLDACEGLNVLANYSPAPPLPVLNSALDQEMRRYIVDGDGELIKHVDDHAQPPLTPSIVPDHSSLLHDPADVIQEQKERFEATVPLPIVPPVSPYHDSPALQTVEGPDGYDIPSVECVPFHPSPTLSSSCHPLTHTSGPNASTLATHSSSSGITPTHPALSAMYGVSADDLSAHSASFPPSPHSSSRPTTPIQAPVVTPGGSLPPTSFSGTTTTVTPAFSTPPPLHHRTSSTSSTRSSSSTMSSGSEHKDLSLPDGLSLKRAEELYLAPYRPDVTLSSSERFYGKVESSKWIEHIRSIIGGSMQIAAAMVHLRCHAMVHCSDGWDRTPQLSSLSMILVDDYYRSLRGFAVIIEREWLGFGHRMSTRLRHAGPRVKKDKAESASVNKIGSVSPEGDISSGFDDSQSSPVFLQWLDCVYQIMSQHPHAFEFNEELLLFLAHECFSDRFGTFSHDNEHARVCMEVPRRTASVWDYVFNKENKHKFINKHWQGIGVALCDDGTLREDFLPGMSILPVNVAGYKYRLWENFWLQHTTRR
ncbi:Myotubularin family like protein, partial [Aduncisulcus paluster]